MQRSAAQHNSPLTRVILLGASNATRGLPHLFETARALFDPAIDMLAAIGHGRSYGASSRALFRRLPGILDCDLWNALDRAPQTRPARRTAALVTDIGNDIIYGRTPTQLLDWVNATLDRLETHCDSIAISALPIENIERIPLWHAKLVQYMTYPARDLPVERAIERARAVDLGVRRIADERRAVLIEPDVEWYRFDPIHIRAGRWPDAALAMLMPLDAEARRNPPAAAVSPSLRNRLRLHTAMPQQFRIAGFRFRCRQPVRTIAGSTLSLY